MQEGSGRRGDVVPAASGFTSYSDDGSESALSTRTRGTTPRGRGRPRWRAGPRRGRTSPNGSPSSEPETASGRQE